MFNSLCKFLGPNIWSFILKSRFRQMGLGLMDDGKPLIVCVSGCHLAKEGRSLLGLDHSQWREGFSTMNLGLDRPGMVIRGERMCFLAFQCSQRLTISPGSSKSCRHLPTPESQNFRGVWLQARIQWHRDKKRFYRLLPWPLNRTVGIFCASRL